MWLNRTNKTANIKKALLLASTLTIHGDVMLSNSAFLIFAVLVV